jgi:hypothetical protein
MLGINFFRSDKKAPNDKPRLLGQKPPLKLKEVDPSALTRVEALPGFGTVQLGNRQQATRL